MERAMNLASVRTQLLEAVALRKKYVPSFVQPPEAGSRENGEVRFEFRGGIMHVSRASDGQQLSPAIPSVGEFYDDMRRLFAIRTDGAVSTFCYHRLKLLQMRFEVYSMVNYDLECEAQNKTSHRDFYNVRKVDTHIHHSAAMNGKHLLRFIKKKLKHFGGDIVNYENGKPVTLREVFQQLKIEWHDLSLDRLDVLADKTTLHRFDRFNAKYSPLGNQMLRTVFLKTDNPMGGRYLAEITRELLDDLEESKYQHTEWRLSIYGRHRQEWARLAQWVVQHRLSSENNMWMIQIPRLYSVYKSAGQINCFQDMLDNIFLPLFEATVDPEAHPEIHEFLTMVSGFDSVDDESKSETPQQRNFSSRTRVPAEWDIMDNPSYKYYNFYLQSNLRILNHLRASRCMSQFSYRPHAGEAGEIHHLDAAFLLADSISHGINLRKCMGLQYLFYLCEIGLALSPCSNNQLFLSYEKHPFYEFFKKGLNVSLSTDDPLMFHQTKEPLMEEYSIAKQLWRLTSADLCELARNSVLQSGFRESEKVQWLGTPRYRQENVIRCTNVPDIRMSFRRQCLEDEMKLLQCEESACADALRWSGSFLTGNGSAAATPSSPMLLSHPVLPFQRPEENTVELLTSAEEGREATRQGTEAALVCTHGIRDMDDAGVPTADLPPPQAAAEGSAAAAGGDALPGKQATNGLKRAPAEHPSEPKGSRRRVPPPRNGEGAADSAAGNGTSGAASVPSVISALGEVGLLGKLLHAHSVVTVSEMAAHLCKLCHEPDKAEAPLSAAVEDVWRLTVLNTREYEQVCKQCFGRVIHHSTQADVLEPKIGANANALEPSRRQRNAPSEC